MKKDYKSPISDEDCRITVDHLLTQEHRDLLIADLVNFHKSNMRPDGILPWHEDGGAWHAGHYQFKVRVKKSFKDRLNASIEKVWQPGKYHKLKKKRF
tara:strand:- start:15433 stop:15726 length:294 start_codon:yes stop_codon:yes gene_type:complete